MDDLVIGSSAEVDKVVKLIGDDDGGENNSVELINLLCEANVYKQVNGIPLVLFYLNTTRHLDIGVLEAFVSHGCDLNVQDERGKTPLHWLVDLNKTTLIAGHRQTMKQMVSLFELFLSNGANPCLVDDKGDNLLMASMNCEYKDWYKLIKPLIANPKYCRQMLTESNKDGFNFWSICIESDCLEPVLFELRSFRQDVDTMKIDEHGNNILHNLFLRLAENRFRIWYKITGKPPKPPSFIDQGQLFTRSLEHFVKSGADVSQKNNDGLVPLQLALLHLNNRLMCTNNELELLIPSNEILAEHGPWSHSIVGLILIGWRCSLIRILVDLVKSNLNCSHGQVLPTALGFKFYKVRLFTALLDGGAVATMDDIKQVLQRIDYLNLEFDSDEKDNELSEDKEVLCLLLERGLPDGLVFILNDAIPGLVAYLLRFTRDAKRSFDNVLLKLLQKGLVFNIRDIRMALYTAQCPESCQYFIEHANPELIVELNAEYPSVFEQIIASTETDYNLFDRFVMFGVHVTVESVLRVFNSCNRIKHINKLVKLMTNSRIHERHLRDSCYLARV